MIKQLRTVYLAPARDGGLYAVSDTGAATYRMDGAELKIYGRIKQAKGTK